MKITGKLLRKVNCMRFNFLLSFIFIISFQTSAQKRCSTNEHVEILKNKYPEYEHTERKNKF